MKRRHVVFSAATFALLAGCGLVPNLSSPATPRLARVGFLDGAPANNAASNDEIAGLKQGLAELGFVDGEKIIFELRNADSKFELLPSLANELIRLPVDVLVTSQIPATQAAQQATAVVPIVFIFVSDPVEVGVVASLAHPGGNVTGVANAPDTTNQKALQILGQLVPGLSRVAIVLNSAFPSAALKLQITATAANAMGVQLKPLDMQSADDVEPALAEALAWQAQAIINPGSPGAPIDASQRIVDFALHNRLPLASSNDEDVKAGALLTYGAPKRIPAGHADYGPAYGRGYAAATFVDKILKGASPADLPVEQPTTFNLIVNQTAAQALGLTFPPEVAQQVTEWVQ